MMGSFSIFHWFIPIGFFGIIVGIIIAVISSSKGDPNEISNTWKFRTVIFTILAFVTGGFIITFPIFLYLAYRSYKAGKPGNSSQTVASSQSGLPIILESQQTATGQTSSTTSEIAELHRLFQQGALTQEEFDQEKRKLLVK